MLGRALRFVGYPYVWAGTSEVTQKLWSATAPGGWVTAPGGFDCSGFVWRVYKTKPFPGAPLLGDDPQGADDLRDERRGEEARADRDRRSRARRRHLLRRHGAQSTPLEVGHTGIYVGNGWFVHSSGAGVTLQPLQGWYTTTFAWARRPLLEAGLDGPEWGRPLDRAGERVALRRLAGLVALREPAPALLRRAVRPGLGIHLALGALLDAIVADRARRVDAAVDVGLGEVLDQPGLDRVVGPDAGVAIGLELRPHRPALGAAALLGPLERAERS